MIRLNIITIINGLVKFHTMKKLACLNKIIQLALKTKTKTTADNEKLILRLKVSIHEVLEFHKNEIEGMNKELNKKKVKNCCSI